MYKRAGKILTLLTPLLIMGASSAYAQSVGDAIFNTVWSFEYIPSFLAAISYLAGITLGITAIIKIYEHVQNPNQTHISEGLKRFLAGGAFLALPIVLEAAWQTVNPGGGNAVEYTGVSGQTTGEGLDSVMQRFMQDISVPMDFAFKAFCYVAGIALVMVGISRLLKTAQEGPRGPAGTGTIVTFLVAGALLSVDAMMGAWSTSTFGSSQVTTYADLAYTGGLDATEVEHIHGVISTILIFMVILGWVSFIRGWFIIRDVAEGSHNASLMAGLTHLFGGALAVNLGPLMTAVQATLGLDGYGVNFS